MAKTKMVVRLSATSTLLRRPPPWSVECHSKRLLIEPGRPINIAGNSGQLLMPSLPVSDYLQFEAASANDYPSASVGGAVAVEVPAGVRRPCLVDHGIDSQHQRGNGGDGSGRHDRSRSRSPI